LLADIERFRRAHDVCVARSRAGQHIEIRALWASIASSYAFLLQREERIIADDAARDGRWQAGTFGGRGS
jgi:hypothetical protein